MKKIKFPRNIAKIRIPFMPEFGTYRKLYKQINKLKVPKTARYIEAVIKVEISLKHKIINEISEVIVSK